jgi:PTS system nitrogen regulatory IIA component
MQLGVKDAARLLEVPEKTIYLWIEEGKLPANRVNDQYRFNRAELLEWATTQKVRVSPDIYREVDDSLPGLGDALSAGGVHGVIIAKDKVEALKAMVGRMRLPEDVDREALFEMLVSREARASTGIGEGVAMPHVRNPMVLPVERPMVSLAFLDPTVDFGAADGQPVHALFTVVSTSIRGHLHLLSRLAYALHEASFKVLLEKKAEEAELVRELRRIEELLKRKTS